MKPFFAIAGALLLALSGCGGETPPPAPETPPPEPPAQEGEQPRETAPPQGESLVYQNDRCGLTVTLPPSETGQPWSLSEEPRASGEGLVVYVHAGQAGGESLLALCVEPGDAYGYGVADGDRFQARGEPVTNSRWAVSAYLVREEALEDREDSRTLSAMREELETLLQEGCVVVTEPSS